MRISLKFGMHVADIAISTVECIHDNRDLSFWAVMDALHRANCYIGHMHPKL